MIKPFFLFVVGVMLTSAALASPTGKTTGEILDVPIHSGEEPTPDGRPHAPTRSLFSAFVDSALGALTVTSRYDVGDVVAVVENNSTGEYYSDTFDSSEIAVLPISGTCGLWRITLTLEDGTEFVGDFSL